MSHHIPTLLQQAIVKHQQGFLQQAEDLYVQVLQIDAQQFDALHMIGLIAKQRGDTQSALNFFAKAIQSNPRDARVHCNLGATLQQIGNSKQALACYDLALTIKADYVLAWNNRGNSLRALERYPEALESFTKALELQINYPEAFLNRGICLQALEQHSQAIQDFDDALKLKHNYIEAEFARAFSLQQLRLYDEAYAAYTRALELTLTADGRHTNPEKIAAMYCNRGMVSTKLQRDIAALEDIQHAISLRPQFAKAYLHAAHVYLRLQQKEAALEHYQAALAATHSDSKPDESLQQQIAYHLAALGAAPTPAAAPASYVKELFDQYADHFDTHLQEQLAYQVPQLLQTALQDLKIGQDKPLSHAIDLGCGTGLCGDFLAAIATRVTGVDLSEKMLAKARARAVYDDLVCDEILHYLAQQSNTADLLIAADVFVYLGDLERLFALFRDRLQTGGYVAFSVEESDSAEICLQASQRYAHSAAYLTRLADQYGFHLSHCSRHFGRRDGQQDLTSLILVLQKN
ncbi:tetratricopeptide repeat protein [Undibacterium baiyunense]|uniref:Tetratricopeptide repeat protein n=1 Tax=Undibacterium baiyunense TaxID=2828731 RepID=A0A941I3C3_9BURK|nr:tetratricopeptide repeat protein [Undibacterium baiyunense]MBR7745879.1 tetratricopeptide repeat protein [Undibacterium baiyunense]